MKTTNLENRLLKGSILFLTITALLMTTLLFTSCSETSEEVIGSETDLISALDNATNRVAIAFNELPPTAQNELKENFENDEIISTTQVPNVGFRIEMVTTEGSWTTEMNQANFDTAGRFVANERRPRQGRRRSCFRIAFPFSVTMPDASVITLASRSDKSLIRQWYADNPSATAKPTIVFPIEIEYQDGTTATINSQAELETARTECKTVRCFDLVYPFSVTMPDASVITLQTRDDRSLIKQWYRDNPGVNQRPTLVFPVDIEYQDGTVITINSQDELNAAKNNCS